MKSNLPYRRRIGLLLAVSMVVGCSATSVQSPTDMADAVFYPEPPLAPRLQFLTSFADAQNVTVTHSTFSDWVVGTSRPTDVSDGRIGNPYGIAARDGRIYVCDVECD